MSDLETAIEIAVQAHKGQREKGGAPYVLHPLRMMSRLRKEEEQMVAVLHDVVEDTAWTLDDLRAQGFTAEIVDGVDAMTRREGEAYEDFVRRAGANPLARTVKLADLEDNMDVRRLPEVTERDAERLRRYRRAWAILTGEKVVNS